MKRFLFSLLIFSGLSEVYAKRQPAEALDRGLVAVRTAAGQVFVSWRLLAEDEADAAFDVYRIREGRETKVNEKPLTSATSLTDAEMGEAYYLKKIVSGKESAASGRVSRHDADYWEIPLQLEDGYLPGDCSVGDLDGNGSYEIILHQSKVARDNSFAGITDPPILEAYQLDGKRLWRINLEKNIRDGEHYTQFMVYDLDGDGKAELACKTADGTVDGMGAVIGDAGKDWRNMEEGSKKFGRILSGPEFFTIFEGASGRALKTVPYVPGRDPIDGWGGIGGTGGNDEYGNRCDRFLACVAYLDGERPSVIMARGVYGRTVLAAWDWRGGELTSRWVFDSGIGYPPYEGVSKFSGMGGHALTVADVDGDGRDEIVYQAMTVDDDGKGLYSTGRRHGDTLHLSDFDPERPGLELFLVTENEERTTRWQTPGTGLHDARTGEPLWSSDPGVDVPRGIVADIDPRHAGAEIWGGPGGLKTIKGKEIGPAPRFADWVIWWDGDLLREIYAGMSIHKWDWEKGSLREIFAASGPESQVRPRRRGRGFRPNLTADLCGDWREEILLPGPDEKSLRLYTSTIPTTHRMVCLMNDPQYRLSIVWQNVVYNKPPHTTRFIGKNRNYLIIGAPEELEFLPSALAEPDMSLITSCCHHSGSTITDLEGTRMKFIALIALAAAFAPTVVAQYPRVPKAAAEEATSRRAAADKLSDEAFAKALPVIEEWAAKGRKYLPGAAEPKDLPQAKIPAFPGAWGGGMYSFGGRGGKVFVITSLNDSGPGSFREACEAGGPRIVLFNVAGIIRLKERIRIRAPYITISGATAPGDGVCIAGNTVELETHDVVIRHMRFRRGETWVGERNDSIGGNPTGNIMIDHVSASWGLDENMSMYRHMFDHDNDAATTELKLPTVNITIQNSIFSEALNTFHHSFGSTIGGLNSTFHHNLWACNAGRNPSVGMYGDFTFANNVLFNWKHRTVDGGDHRSYYNILNNYLKPGPVTPAGEPVSYRLLKPESERSKTVFDHFGKAHVAGNVVEGNERVTRDNWDGGVQPDSRAPVASVVPSIRADAPHPHAAIPIQPAAEAFEAVLTNSGATMPRRDAVDERVMTMVRTGKPTAKAAPGVAASLANPNFNEKVIDELVADISKGIITHPDQVGGYPKYAGEPYTDADADGLPDTWEDKHGLNGKDPSDASSDADNDGYMNVEEFLNGSDPRH